ncbi:NADPH-dependent F420 reductase [Microbacterium sp. E-13]|uniref:NADPH-dependent F420 reductase n=1 Tax=Microbacterium sp. E-13 TaxID=3404048 RepID=UPI003CEE4BAF
MHTISIIGAGNLGSALARVAAAGGARVQVVARDIAKARQLAEQVGGEGVQFGSPLIGEIVFLAVPYAALSEVISTYGEQLEGMTVVDVTNPVDFDTFDSLAVASDSSAARELQQALPDASVVKAFNTNFAATLVSGEVGGVPATVVIAGDDADAKARVSEVVTAGGIAVADAGSLKRARELEALGFLQIVLAVREEVTWAGGFAVRS